MTYWLGIDLGTTYTSAAVARDGRVEIAPLGNRAAVIPSVVFLRDDEAVLTGEAATRRGATEPTRMAREFKRRLGDPTPMIVGGVPYSADALMAKLLRSVVDQVAAQQGGPASGICVSYPANWGPYKTDLLRQAVIRAGLDDVATITEPEAAAVHYASQSRVETGAVVAVFDLGGGTFDAAVMRKRADGRFETLGEPQGIERLGGVDFDEAVFRFVLAAVGDAVAALDPDDPTTLAALARLRQECVDAKEALSSDTDASVPVILPNLQTEVRLTRTEFESLVRPTLGDAIAALERTLRSAGVAATDITTVLLVGGSSRIPLVAQMVGSALGRPVAVDAHPKHGVALGAALHAASLASAARPAPVPVVPPPPPPPPAPTSTPASAAAAPAPAVIPSTSSVVPPPPPVAAAATVVTAGAVSDVPLVDAPTDRSRRGLAVGVGVVAVLALVIAGIVLLGGDDAPAGGGAPVTEPDGTTAVDPTDPPVTDAPVTEAPTTVSAPATSGDLETTVAPASAPIETGPIETGPPTTEFVPPDHPYVRITAVTIDGDKYVAQYEVYNYVPQIDGGPESLHVHLFLDDVESINAGVNGPSPGLWDITDHPTTFRTSVGPADAVARDAFQMCALVARVDHTHLDHTADTCVPLPDR